MSEIVFALHRPKPGREAELAAIIETFAWASAQALGKQRGE